MGLTFDPLLLVPMGVPIDIMMPVYSRCYSRLSMSPERFVWFTELSLSLPGSHEKGKWGIQGLSEEIIRASGVPVDIRLPCIGQ